MAAATADLFIPKAPDAILGYPVKASTTIYRGVFVGDDAAGYARALVAGDPFRGIAQKQADNSSGAAADIEVQTHLDAVQLAVGSLAITDVGQDVYASDDNTATLTQGSNTRIGYVKQFISTGIGIVVLQANTGVEAELTDSSGGTASDTLANVTEAQNAGSADRVPTENALASLAAKVNYILRRLGQ